MTAAGLHTLPKVRGNYVEHAGLKDLVWFRVGGAADLLFRPADIEDLRHFMAAKPSDLPLMVIGVGSNLLIRDGGIAGVVIRLPAAFGRVEVLSDAHIRAGAAALDAAVARAAADGGIAGLEFLRGIPGTIGGALTMNAGCYGSEMKDVLVEARAVDSRGTIMTFSREEMGFRYRHSEPRDVVFIDAVLRGTPGESDEIRSRMEALVAQRESTQPVRSKTGGSTFTNPAGHKAWHLIDAAGCRGLILGGAQVSEKHCNFLINMGEATATDLEALGEQVRSRVLAKFGVALEWEIKRIGRAEGGQA
jgi:UDP-N-acetylmuramate dehydrogenase